MTTDAPNAAGALETLSHAERLRRTTRRAARSIWFPLLAFGAATAGSAAFCANGGLPSNALNFYWVIAGPAAYVGCLLFYRRRERQVGVGEHPLPFAAAGLVLLLFTVTFISISEEGGGFTTSSVLDPSRYLTTWPAFVAATVVAILAYRYSRRGLAIMAGSVAVCALLFATSWMSFPLSYAHILLSNTLPVIIAAIALLVLAAIERSPTLAVIAVLLGTAAGLSGIYWIDNRFDALPNCAADLGGMGGFLATAGGIAYLVERRRVR